MDNQKILVTRSSMPTFDEYTNEIKELWDSHWLTNMGKKHNQLQSQLKEYLKVDNIELMVNGHMALELTLQALNIQGEVITTPFTFASTTHAIVRNGCIPVFCDINSDDYTIDITKIEQLISDNTSAIMPVHVYGNICNIEEIERISKKYGLKVIYDAAHTFGAEYKGKGLGFYGDASCYSFHATKVFNTIEGGAVCYKNSEMGPILCRLRDFGIRSEEVVDGVGANAKMNEFAAAMGICNLRHINEYIAGRKKVVERYVERLSNVDGIHLCHPQKDVTSNYAYFPVVFEESIFGSTRNEVFNALQVRGISVRKYFYPLTNTFDCFHGRFDASKTPVALHISKRVLTLPLYSELTNEQVDRICDIIINCKK